ncbi:hypothetical protein AYO44_18345 [Planctomycetaceae bacterium SCGC AG-212-F19]|nr:hypothetical protein AYO44_18345 [Planctomycetaceae bacterium SCGC AG-212-F19]
MTSSSGLGEDADFDPLKEARAYNNSILFMLSMPYVILAFGGGYVYLAVRRNRALAAQTESREPQGATASSAAP